MTDVTRVGRILKVNYVTDDQIEDDMTGSQVRAVYGFGIISTFYEPDSFEADRRKADYSRMLKNRIDKDPGFGGAAIAITVPGPIRYTDHPEIEGLYYGAMTIVVARDETRGNR